MQIGKKQETKRYPERIAPGKAIPVPNWPTKVPKPLEEPSIPTEMPKEKDVPV